MYLNQKFDPDTIVMIFINIMNENFLVRTQRLKQAKEEAEKEAAQYRIHMEDEYQKSLSEVYTHTFTYEFDLYFLSI